MRPRTHRVLISNNSGRRCGTTAIRNALKILLAMYDTPPTEVSVMLVDDVQIQELNANWRGINQPTDVLSFNGDPFPGAALGDIVISVETAARQAATHGHARDQELCLLAIHGGLHLLGYDDESEQDFQDMTHRMGEVARNCNLPWTGEWHTISDLDPRPLTPALRPSTRDNA